jgi:hypothetical protein
MDKFYRTFEESPNFGVGLGVFDQRLVNGLCRQDKAPLRRLGVPTTA